MSQKPSKVAKSAGGARAVRACSRRIGIIVAERHAADDDLVLWDVEDRPDHLVEIGERRLRAGVESVAARGDHEAPR